MMLYPTNVSISTYRQTHCGFHHYGHRQSITHRRWAENDDLDLGASLEDDIVNATSTSALNPHTVIGLSKKTLKKTLFKYLGTRITNRQAQVARLIIHNKADTTIILAGHKDRPTEEVCFFCQNPATNDESSYLEHMITESQNEKMASVYVCTKCVRCLNSIKESSVVVE